jgi:hypothetical protein
MPLVNKSLADAARVQAQDFFSPEEWRVLSARSRRKGSARVLRRFA